MYLILLPLVILLFGMAAIYMSQQEVNPSQVRRYGVMLCVIGIAGIVYGVVVNHRTHSQYYGKPRITNPDSLGGQ